MLAPEIQLELAASDGILFGPFGVPVFRITGKDAERYLHGRVTQDIRGIETGCGARSLVLTPQGRILGHFLVLKEDQGYLLISDPLATNEARTEFLRSILQFKVADDVSAEDLSDTLVQIVFVGGDLTNIGLTVRQGHFGFTTASLFGCAVTAVRHRRGKLSAFDFLFRNEDAGRVLDLLSEKLAAPVGDTRGFELIRIASKIPRMEADLSEKVLGPEIDLTELASFHKGCYAGQEVVEMATARGRPNRMLTLFEAEGAAPLEPGSDIISYDGSKSCGTITSSAVLPIQQKILALGFLKTAHSEEAQFNCAGHLLRKSS